MKSPRREDILDKMMTIGKQIDSYLDEETAERGNMLYCRDLQLKGNTSRASHGLERIYIVEIKNKKDSNSTYGIYGEDGEMIGSVSEDGKVHFTQEYIEYLKQFGGAYVESLNLEDMNFELPEELGKDDIIMTKEELEEYDKEQEKSKEVGEKPSKQKSQVEEKEQEEEEPEQENEKEKSEEEKIAERKGIPVNNVLKIRENSNLYKDHPNLEPNLYFYRGEDGIVRAEYLDENGVPQPSKYIEDSRTALPEPTIELGNDGNPVEKRVPYQMMQTKNLASTDKDVRAVRININIDAYGYLELSESRQGMNGEWVAHDIEVRGRDYNSRAVNATTSIRTGKADPDKQTDAYNKTEGTQLEQDGIQYSEMYLMAHSEEVIREFIEEGYNKDEAIKIFDLMIGKESLSEEEAKKEVNKEIEEKEQEKEKSREQDDDDQKTPWSDAMSRRERY